MKLTPATSTSISAWPGPGRPGAISSTTRTSGPPWRGGRTARAFMSVGGYRGRPPESPAASGPAGPGAALRWRATGPPLRRPGDAGVDVADARPHQVVADVPV